MLYYIILLHVGMFILYYLVISLFSVVLFIGYIYLFIVEKNASTECVINTCDQGLSQCYDNARAASLG